MNNEFLSQLFSLKDQVAIVTGGTGVLGGEMARGLAQAGAKVGILGRRQSEAEKVVAQIESAGGQALALPADVLIPDQLQAAQQKVLDQWGRIDILINAAGGNVPAATVLPDQSFMNVPREAFSQVFDLNLTGTLLPTQIFASSMAAQQAGVVINISSMAASRAITRVIGYSAAKAAVENFTRWLAVELAQKHGAGLRVNAIAPGFFVGEQNRRLLLNEDNTLTDRGRTIIQHTPMGRFGDSQDLVSTLVWLCSPGAKFVTGVVVPVDGGFSAFSGV